MVTNDTGVDSQSAAVTRILRALPSGVTFGLAEPSDRAQILDLLQEQGVCHAGLDYSEFGVGGTTIVAKVGWQVVALVSGYLGKPCSWVTELASRRVYIPRTRVALAVATLRVWEELMVGVGSQAWCSVCDSRLPEIAHLTEWYGAQPMGVTTVYQRIVK